MKKILFSLVVLLFVAVIVVIPTTTVAANGAQSTVSAVTNSPPAVLNNTVVGTATDMADISFIDTGQNRVILMSNGLVTGTDNNIGQSSCIWNSADDTIITKSNGEFYPTTTIYMAEKSKTFTGAAFFQQLNNNFSST